MIQYILRCNNSLGLSVYRVIIYSTNLRLTSLRERTSFKPLPGCSLFNSLSGFQFHVKGIKVCFAIVS
jgi:hypothetical protein